MKNNIKVWKDFQGWEQMFADKTHGVDLQKLVK